MDLISKLKEKKILLVDDNEYVRNAMTLFFECEGCYLRALETAEEGIEALKSQDYDIVISDYRLPGMNGLELIREARKVRPGLTAILMTGYGTRHLREELMDLGGCQYLDKPFRLGRLLETIGVLMR